MGTIRLTAAAPSGGASVTLSSNNTDVARVASPVSIAAGSTSNTFNVDASTVSSSTTVTITGTYAGVSKTGTFTVAPPPLDPRITVTSRSKGTDACSLTDTDGTNDCLFDASRSTGNVARFYWKITLANNAEFRWDTTESRSTISPNCGFWEDATSTKILDSFNVTASLVVRSRDGRDSTATRRTIKVYPGSNCGYDD